MFYKDVYFKFYQSGTTIILTSGNKINLDMNVNLELKDFI